MLEINLLDNVAVVTGVTSGIGAGIAKMLARAGCKIAGCGRSAQDSESAAKFRETVKTEGAECFYRSVDVTVPGELEKFVKLAHAEFGRIDLAVSNAGVNVFKGAENATDEDWDYNSNLNLRSHWILAKSVKPMLERSQYGTLIIITSNHAYHTLKGCFPYNVAKAGLVGMVKSLAVEWGPSVRTVGIAPGFIMTEANNRWFDSFDDPDAELKKTIEIHPVRKFGSVDEIGALCAFLSSDFAGFISGTTLLVDGGRSAVMQDR